MSFARSQMFDVICSGMVWDTLPTYQEAIEVALALGLGAYVQKFRPIA